MKKVINVLFVTLLALGAVSTGRAMLPNRTFGFFIDNLKDLSSQMNADENCAVWFEDKGISVYTRNGRLSDYSQTSYLRRDHTISCAAINPAGDKIAFVEGGKLYTCSLFLKNMEEKDALLEGKPMGKGFEASSIRFEDDGNVEVLSVKQTAVGPTLFESPWFRYGLPVALVTLVAGGVAYYVANKNKEKADTPEGEKAIEVR